MSSTSNTGWHAHYESLDDEFELFEREAADYVERLTAAVDIPASDRVLDFGCGFGRAARLLAPRVRELYVWDAAANMRARAELRLQDFPNVSLLDLSDPQHFDGPAFDLILVNSVVQYMSLEQFAGWLDHWRTMLGESGRIVVSDIITPDSGIATEVLDSLRFAWSHGFLLQSIRKAVAELGRYLKARRTFPLFRMSAAKLGSQARNAGLSCQLLPDNLTYRRARLSAVLTSSTAVAVEANRAGSKSSATSG